MRTASAAIVQTAFWIEARKSRCTYSEGSQRMSAINRPWVMPFVADCSAFVTVCYNWAGAPDPNHLHYDGYGYTGTLLSAGEHLALFRVNGRGVRVEEVEPGDVVVLGPGVGVHTALIVSKGEGDPICISMGKPGDPEIVRVSQMAYLGEQTYLRFNTMTRKVHYPPGHRRLR